MDNEYLELFGDNYKAPDPKRDPNFSLSNDYSSFAPAAQAPAAQSPAASQTIKPAPQAPQVQAPQAPVKQEAPKSGLLASPQDRYIERKLENKGFMSRFGENLLKAPGQMAGGILAAGKGAVEGVQEFGGSFMERSDNQAENLDRFAEGQGPISTALQIVGDSFGLVGDAIGDVGGGIISALDEEAGGGGKEALRQIAETPLGQSGLNAFKEGAEKFAEFKESHPTLANNIEAVGNVVTAGVGSSATKVGLKGAVNTVEGLGEGALKAGETVLDATRRIDAPSLPKPNAPKVASGIVNRINKVNPKRAEDFTKAQGKNMGEWLTDRGIIGTRDETIAKTFDWFNKSRKEVNEAMAKIPGKYQDKVIDDVLGQSLEHATKVKDPVAKKLLGNLNKANEGGGLTMEQINSVKRYYQKNFSFGYQKDLTKSSEKVLAATNTDKALREFQFAKAKEAGFNDLGRLNKETQAAKAIMDAVGEKQLRQLSNNAVSLTDWMMASGVAANPAAISALLGKKIFGSETIQAVTAKLLAGKKTVDTPKADTTSIERRAKIGTKETPTASSTNSASPKVRARQSKRDRLDSIADDIKAINPKSKVSREALQKRFNTMRSNGKVESFDEFEFLLKEEIKKRGEEVFKNQSLKDGIDVDSKLQPELQSSIDAVAKSMNAKAIPMAKTLGIKKANPTQADAIDFISRLDAPSLRELAQGNTTKTAQFARELGLDTLDEYSIGGKLGEDDVFEQIIESFGKIDKAKQVTAVKPKTVKPKKFIATKARGSVQIDKILPGAKLLDKTDDLVEQAKKFKSAEEFVDDVLTKTKTGIEEDINTLGIKTGEAVKLKSYHGTDADFEEFVLQEGGVRYSGDGHYFTPSKSGASNFGKYTKEVVLDLKNPYVKYIPEGNTDQQFFELAKEVKERGHDGIIVRMTDSNSDDWVDSSGKLHKKGVTTDDWINEIVVFDEKAIKTKKQLTDIWNKANKGVGQTDDLVERAKKFKSAEEFARKGKRDGVPLYEVEKIDTDFVLDSVDAKKIGYDFEGRYFEDITKSEKKIKENIERLKKGERLDPVLINTKGDIIDGQHRMHAYELLGYDEIPVYRAKNKKTTFDNIRTRTKDIYGEDIQSFLSKLNNEK